MANPIVITKNITGSPITIKDLSGVTVDSTSQITLTDIFHFYTIASSINLKTYVTNGNIVINNGTSDLSIANGLEHITIKSSYEATQEISNYVAGHHFGNSPPDSTSTIWIDAQHYHPRVFDVVRGKWLSFSRSVYTFSYLGLLSGGYLNVGHVRTSECGFVTPHIGCIVEISVLITTPSDTSARFSLRHCGIPFYYFNMDGSNLNYRDVDVNEDIQEECILQCYSEDQVKNPVVSVTVAWRHE